VGTVGYENHINCSGEFSALRGRVNARFCNSRIKINIKLTFSIFIHTYYYFVTVCGDYL